MADRAGALVGALNVVQTAPDKRRGGYELPSGFSPYFSLPDKRRPGSTASFAKNTYYRLRARDDGQPSPPLYTTWISTNATSIPPGTPIGSWVEIAITEKWTA